MSTHSSVPLSTLAAPIFVLGPAYSGKSELAHQLCLPQLKTAVIGTAGLAELEKRVQTLKKQRPTSWEHIEGPGLELADTLRKAASSHEQVLVDSLNQWLANLLLEGMNKYDLQQQEARIEHECKTMVETMRQTRSRIVIVSSEIGAGVTPPQEVARFFRQMLGQSHVMIARAATTVVQVTAGIPSILKS